MTKIPKFILVYDHVGYHWMTWLSEVWLLLSLESFCPPGSYLRPITFPKVQLRDQFLQEVFLDIPARNLFHYLHVLNYAHCHILIHLQNLKFGARIYKVWDSYNHSPPTPPPNIRISGFSWKLENLTPWASIPSWQQLGRAEKQLSAS